MKVSIPDLNYLAMIKRCKGSIFLLCRISKMDYQLGSGRSSRMRGSKSASHSMPLRPGMVRR